MGKESLQRPSIVPEAAWADAGDAARRCLIDLAGRLGMNSSNSSLPPSSDGPADQSPGTTDESSSKNESKKKSGGQPGHRRNERPLIPTDDCDDVRSVRPDVCECGRCLDDVQVQPELPPHRHQVVDLPEIKRIVTEYQRQRLQCPDCGRIVLAKLPAGVPPGGFGPGVITAVTMLGGMCRLSQRLTVELLKNLLGLSISTGMISKLQAIGRQALEPIHQDIAVAVRTSDQIHADETSWREAGAKAWLWTAVAPLAILFLIRKSRSGEVARELIGENFRGVVITDRYTSYHWIKETLRQFCGAHLLRDFQAMIDAGGGAAEIGTILITQGRLLIHEWKKGKAGKITHATFRRHAAKIRREINSAVIDGLSCDHSKTEGVCTELLKHFESLWTFLKHELVEPTNNRAERSVRHGVLWRKVSHGTASAKGSRYVETILSVLATCKQNAINPFEFVAQAVKAKLQNQTHPQIITTDP